MILVTGAAGAIGEATVRTLLAAGHAVVGWDRDPRVGALLEHPRFAGRVVDVRDPEQVARAVEAGRQGGPLRHLVQIAGGALPEEPGSQDDPLALSVESFRSSVELNLVSPFTVLRAALPWLRDGAPGDRSITLTSSFNALTAAGMPAYSAAKAGLLGMMRALARPLGREGIRINAVAPGTVPTPRTERLWADHPGHWERLTASTALGRLGTPEDVARAYLALIGLPHVTGQLLVVDGGQTLHRP